MASPSSTDSLWMILIVGGMCLLLMSTSSSQSTGKPCYCEKCEHKLLQKAQNGDKNAQEKLALAIAVEEGEYQRDPSTDPLATLFRVILFGLLMYMLFLIFQSLTSSPDDSGMSPLSTQSVPMLSPARRSSTASLRRPSVGSVPRPSVTSLSSSVPRPSVASLSSSVPRPSASLRRPSASLRSVVPQE